MVGEVPRPESETPMASYVLRTSSRDFAPYASHGGLSASWQVIQAQYSSEVTGKIEAATAQALRDVPALSAEIVRFLDGVDLWLESDRKVGESTWFSVLCQGGKRIDFEVCRVG